MNTVGKDQRLRGLVAQVLTNFGILEQEHASTSFNYLVTFVGEQLPKMQTLFQTQVMLREAIFWYFFQSRPFSKATLTGASRALWSMFLAYKTDHIEEKKQQKFEQAQSRAGSLLTLN